MLTTLVSRSPALQRLRDEGYDIEVREGFLLVHDVPYVTERSEVARGVLIGPVKTDGEQVLAPDDHTMLFAGEFPCDEHGTRINMDAGPGGATTRDLQTTLRFSKKPESGRYCDWHQKVTTYVTILSSPAQALDTAATAKTFVVRESPDDDSPFLYMDTASSNAGVVAANAKLALGQVGIIGLGGTGSFILDLVAKTPVREIHLFDGDTFFAHNAFRAPGAASLEDLRARPKKVDYFADIYGRMRRGVIPHAYDMTPDRFAELDQLDFVFICIDKGAPKRAIAERLESIGMEFIDVGMGIRLDEGVLDGQLRVTISTRENRASFWSRVPTADPDEDDNYDRNIQIADLNALNATLAVVRWKKRRGFYSDDDPNANWAYTISWATIRQEDPN